MKKHLFLFIICAALVILLSVSASAETDYRIVVDKSVQRVTVYSTSDGSVVHRWACSTGQVSSSTPEGTFILPEPPNTSDRTDLYLPSEGQYFRWATRIRGAILFHTYLYDSKDEGGLNLESVYGIGSPISHGCVRLPLEAARWIALNCPPGTKVEIIAGDGTGLTEEIKFADSVQSISLSHTGTVDIVPGERFQVYADTEPAGGAGVWVSSNPKIASVSQNGTVTGLKDGAVEIAFVAESGVYAAFTTDVHDYSVLRSVSIDEGESITLQPGDQLQLHTTVIHDTVPTTLTWSVASTSIATVSSAGLVTAIADGTTTVAVRTSNNKVARITVHVEDPLIPRSVTLSQHEITLNLGESVTLDYTVSPDTASRDVRWTADTLNYITQSNGTVTGKAVGTAVVAVHTLKGGCTDKVTIRVVDPAKPSSITIDGEKSIRLAIGETRQLSCTLLPSTAVTGLIWSSSATAYVRITDTGMITGRMEGTSTVSVKTSILSKTDSIKVTVYDPAKATAVVLPEGNEVLLHAGDVFTPVYQLEPATATGGVTLSSSNTAVLSVSSGKATAVKAGTATLTLKAASGVTAKMTVTVHAAAASHPEVSAACEAYGYTEGRYCSTCGIWVSGHEEIPPLGHSPVVQSCSPAGAADGVLGPVVCFRCGTVFRESVSLPAGALIIVPRVSAVAEEAFMGCSAVQITIENGTSAIGSGAFADCGRLRLVIIPDSVTSIAENAFDGTPSPVLMCSEGNQSVIDYAERHGLLCIFQ